MSFVEGKSEGVSLILPLSAFLLIYLWIQVLLVDPISEMQYHDIRVVGFYTAVLVLTTIILFSAGRVWQSDKVQHETGLGVLISSLVLSASAFVAIMAFGLNVITPLTIEALFVFFVVFLFASIEELLRYSSTKLIAGYSGRFGYYTVAIVANVFFAFLHYARAEFSIPTGIIWFFFGVLLSFAMQETRSFVGVCLAHTLYNFALLGWGISLPIIVALILFVGLEIRSGENKL